MNTTDDGTDGLGDPEGAYGLTHYGQVVICRRCGKTKGSMRDDDYDQEGAYGIARDPYCHCDERDW